MNRVISFLVLFILLFAAEGKSQMQEILGITSPNEIREANRIYDIYINRYKPDEQAITFLHNFEYSIDIKVLFGTWCHDSTREIPSFIKTMEETNNPNFTIQYIGINRGKSDPEGHSDPYNLQYTPTFIIFSAENEIGRIVEESTESIEQDLVQILKSGDFKDD